MLSLLATNMIKQTFCGEFLDSVAREGLEKVLADTASAIDEPSRNDLHVADDLTPPASLQEKVQPRTKPRGGRAA